MNDNALRPGNARPNWAELESLAAEHGDGFWLLDLDRYQRNLHEFRKEFVRAGWLRSTMAWSFKTSWLPPVVRAAMKAGALSEVTSRHEYELALALGADGGSIIFNGPLKTRADLDFSCGRGSRVHLDSANEVADVKSLAREHRDRVFHVGLRANIDIGQVDRGRFGIDAETGDLQRAFHELVNEPNIIVNALHIHLSAARQADAYTKRITHLIRLTDELWTDDHPLDYLDVGGGFSGTIPESLRKQMGSTPETPRTYANAIVPALLQRWPQGGPQLILEPGMALAADTMQFAARVGATKSIGSKRHAIVTASVYTVKPTLHKMNMPFQLVSSDNAPRPQARTIVSGWTCMENDVLATDCPIALQQGDWLLFDNCGAYTFVLNPRFIRGTPAILASDSAGGWTALRPADTVDDWLAPFKEST